MHVCVVIRYSAVETNYTRKLGIFCDYVMLLD